MAEKLRLRLRFVLGGFLLAWFGMAQGAAFNVSPIGFSLSAERSAGVLQIRNAGEALARVQVQVFDWTTDGKSEVLSYTNALIVNPPIFEMAPGQTQFMRFGLRRPEAFQIEKSYRLILDEVPSGGPQAPGITTRLQISIPVFYVPAVKQEKVSWKLKLGARGLVLTAVNEGNVHLKIIAITVSDLNGRTGLQIRSPAYVLPGQHKEWDMAASFRAHDARLRIQTDKGEFEELLTLEAEPVSGR